MHLLIAIVTFAAAATTGAVDSKTAVEALTGQEWQKLAMITAVHSVRDKKAGLAMRVLEADGSSSVAENPVSLFVVATNDGTSDVDEHIWMLPAGVAKVIRVSACRCGVEIAADVEGEPSEPGAPGRISRSTIRACFRDNHGRMGTKLTVEMMGSVAAR